MGSPGAPSPGDVPRPHTFTPAPCPPRPTPSQVREPAPGNRRPTCTWSSAGIPQGVREGLARGALRLVSPPTPLREGPATCRSRQPGGRHPLPQVARETVHPAVAQSEGSGGSAPQCFLGPRPRGAAGLRLGHHFAAALRPCIPASHASIPASGCTAGPSPPSPSLPWGPPARGVCPWCSSRSQPSLEAEWMCSEA